MSKLMIKRLSALESVTKIQCSDGNWNNDSYMHGMANGLILAQSIMMDTPCDFLEAPDTWLEDIDTEEEVMAVDPTAIQIYNEIASVSTLENWSRALKEMDEDK